MRIALFFILLLTTIACGKSSEEILAEENRKTDSINAAVAKYNDSVTVLNNTNRFADLSGTRPLSFSSDEANIKGKINFTKTGRDLYDVSGKIQSGNNSLSVNGTIKRVSEKHLNFDGKIIQKTGSSTYERNKKTTFYDEGKGNFWRLQDKVNSDGFIDYIDIHK